MNSFDAQSHTYEINGCGVPSVTQVLGDLLPCWRASEWHMQRGQAVHACAALIAQGVAFDHDPAIDGQVRAVRRFFAEVKPVVLAVEQQVFHAGHQYAGTFDMVAKLKDTKGKIAFDWKASITASVPFQLAAYALAIPMVPEISKGCAVEIRDDGTYRMSPIWDLRQYKNKWLALLSTYKIRRQCGVKTEE